MGRAIEVVTGTATAPGATFTELTAAAGNSFTVRNAREGTGIWLANAWADVQGAGVLRLRSPSMHDNVQGLRLQTTIGQVTPLLPWGPFQRMQAQDAITADITGSGTSGDIETACLTLVYEDLPGIEGRFIDRSELEQRMQSMVTVENTITTGAGGGYTGEEAINAEFALLHANTDYALLGAIVQQECGVVRYRGTDFGNLGVGVPGEPGQPQLTSRFFVHMTELLGMPLIPVFNSANSDGVLVDVAQDEDGADVTVSAVLAELSSA